ncbi:TPA: hypothetical protein R4193_003723 [Serratia marcescens]|nr:hypothetical protein [Serratia marcescens]EHT9830917.1 hypothetical protein [Serratia marcescens]EIU0972399.1 hypothetical protein [Serratia marcescens]EMB7754852.1 hypothetical protein [Serratia marcescens]MDP8763215.1 colicin immunity domain-containing protein [Serratia marcescens]
MSMKLIEIAQALLDSKLTADEYESQYLNVWRKERDDGTIKK